MKGVSGVLLGSDSAVTGQNRANLKHFHTTALPSLQASETRLFLKKMQSVNAVSFPFIQTLEVTLDSLGKGESLGFFSAMVCDIKVTGFFSKYKCKQGSCHTSCLQVVTGAWLLAKSEIESMVITKQQPRLLPRVGKFSVGKKSGWESHWLSFSAGGRLWATFYSG